MVSVLGAKPNLIPLKYMFPIQISNRIMHIYLMLTFSWIKSYISMQTWGSIWPLNVHKTLHIDIEEDINMSSQNYEANNGDGARFGFAKNHLALIMWFHILWGSGCIKSEKWFPKSSSFPILLCFGRDKVLGSLTLPRPLVTRRRGKSLPNNLRRSILMRNKRKRRRLRPLRRSKTWPRFRRSSSPRCRER